MRVILILLLALCGGWVRAGNWVDIELVDRETGRTLVLYEHAGRQWIAGAPGHRYTVRLINRSAERVLAVLSVDGVNAVSGETASPQQAGYVLGPGQRTDINGWRKSLAQVAAFEFTSLPDSYAAQTGRPNNVGVVGVAVFRERQPAPLSYRQNEIAPAAKKQPRGRAESSPSPAGAAADSYTQSAELERSRAVGQAPLGTGHGAHERSQAREVAFERDSIAPFQVVSLYYDSYPNLVAMGVIPSRSRFAPDPFPLGFVPDP